ncbi:MAG TPA: peptidylprolyl isomerase [Gammaproteobacteria bacterium]|nr:peptidylprolyl isomerase [Gammaproteobacteria bacterium]
MRKSVRFLFFLCICPLLWAFTASAPVTIESADLSPMAQNTRPTFEIDTNYGAILIELFDDLTPETVDNFTQYVKEEFYNDTVVHQVLPGFIIQAGSYDHDFKPKETHAPIHNEASRAPHHTRGTIAMMRNNDPNSATSEFFINLDNNELFDIPNGYAVFGQVVRGFDVLEKISELETCGKGPFYDDVPCQPVVIEKVVRVS